MAPCPGKDPLSRFHMTECQAADGEFLGWKRTETDFLVHELGTIILKTGIYGFGGAMSRKAYESLVVGDYRRATGDAETVCVINCFATVLELAKNVAPGQQIAMVFDRARKRELISRKSMMFIKEWTKIAGFSRSPSHLPKKCFHSKRPTFSHGRFIKTR